MKLITKLGWSSALGLAAFGAIGATQVRDVVVNLKYTPDIIGPKGELWGMYPWRNTTIDLSKTKPDDVTKEPKYRGEPQYGRIKIGDGVYASYNIVVVDNGKDSQLFIDLNRNGDLSDDNDGEWNGATDVPRNRFTSETFKLRASYRTAPKDPVDYGVFFIKVMMPEGMKLAYRRSGLWRGSAELDGKKYDFTLMENDGDAIFSKQLGPDGQPRVGKEPVWVFLNDETQTGLDVRKDIQIGGKTYKVRVKTDGSQMVLTPVNKEAAADPRNGADYLIPAGSKAPDFMALSSTGAQCNLADFKGKIVVLDFWATWCGPCKASMPHLEEIYKQVKNQDVVVMSVCVLDDKSAYDAWCPANKDTYTFPTYFDPAGKDREQSVGNKLFGVRGIPTVFVIGKDGNIAGSVLGYTKGDTRLDEMLKKEGVKLN